MTALRAGDTVPRLNGVTPDGRPTGEEFSRPVVLYFFSPACSWCERNLNNAKVLAGGYSFIRRVRSLPSSEGGTVPAVALTAYAATGDRARASTAGFQLHIAKPFDPIELARVVQRLAMTEAK